MPGRRKYPKWPGPDEKEVPYDTEHFKMWCVNQQDMTISTANAYVSSIRTAFSSLYDEDPLFENLRAVFSSPNKPDLKLRVKKIEEVYEQLLAHTETIKDVQYDMLMDPRTEYDEIPKDEWITAFQTYCRFIRWRLDNARRWAGMKIAKPVDDPASFLNVPMASFFRQYLEKTGYSRASIDSLCAHLKRLYNLFIRQHLKKDVIEEFEWSLKRRKYSVAAIKAFFEKLDELIEEEKEYNTVEELDYNDMVRGKCALKQYSYFIIDYAKDPDKYKKESYIPF